MKTNENIAEKRKYNAPEIICIKLDNEISLALESTPPEGPDEAMVYFKNDAFKLSQI